MAHISKCFFFFSTNFHLHCQIVNCIYLPTGKFVVLLSGAVASGETPPPSVQNGVWIVPPDDTEEVSTDTKTSSSRICNRILYVVCYMIVACYLVISSSRFPH